MGLSVYLILFSIFNAVYAEYFTYSKNVTRTSLSGIMEYRSVLTLDWLAAEDSRQHLLAAAYEAKSSSPMMSEAFEETMECLDYPRPTSGEVTKLMLELLQNLEDDDSILVSELVRVLVRSKFLTFMHDSKPDMDTLMKAPDIPMAEPHITVPSLLAIMWILITDTATTRNSGWCSFNKINDYLAFTKPMDVSKHLRLLEPMVSRARYVMEVFIQNVTSLSRCNDTECTSTPKVRRNVTADVSTALPRVTVRYSVCAEDYYYAPGNVTRATLSGINAYRSALTLDWLAAEDTRQREIVAAYETEPSAPVKNRIMECVDSPKPSTRKVGKLMLELLKNLEGDDGILVPELIQMLMRSKLLMETSILDSEPDLDSLMKTPMMIMGEPHVTFPRVLAIVWMLVTDATTTRNDGWCSIKRVNEYLGSSKPTDIAKHLRVLEPVVARARFIMEEFIQNMTPLNLHQDDTTIKIPKENKPKQQTTTDEIVDVLAELPRANGEKDVKRDDKKREEFSDVDMEYASTRVLEQAQQFADLEDVTPVSAANKLTGIVYVLTFTLFIICC